MSVKSNVMMAGGVAAIIGILKFLNQGAPIPTWMTIAVWLPIIALIIYAVIEIVKTGRDMEDPPEGGAGRDLTKGPRDRQD